MDSKTDLQSIALDIHGLLAKYSEIHNSLFKFSVRRIIPLPFLFEAIDCCSLQAELDELCAEMARSREQLQEVLSSYTDAQFIPFGNCLREYCESLLVTLGILRDLVYQLHLKSQGRSYDWRAYQAQLASYNASVTSYKAIGKQTNELYNELYRSERA